jgi:chromosome partitioning protein
MARIYSIANNKGGVGKSTNVVELGYYCAQHGYKTLIIDIDPQCNTTYTLLGEIFGTIEDEQEDASPEEEQFEELSLAAKSYWEGILGSLDGDDDGESEEGEPIGNSTTVYTLFDVLIGVNRDPRKKRPLKDALVALSQQTDLYLIRGSTDLIDMDVLLSSTSGRENLLARAIYTIMDQFDIILIDTPPTLGLGPVNAFIAAGSSPDNTNGVVIIISPQAYSVLGIRLLTNAFRVLRRQMEIPVPIFGVIFSNAKRTKNAKKRMRQTLGYFKSKVFKTIIPVNEKVEEAADEQQSLFDYAPKSTGADAYSRLGAEFLARAGLPPVKPGHKEVTRG